MNNWNSRCNSCHAPEEQFDSDLEYESERVENENEKQKQKQKQKQKEQKNESSMQETRTRTRIGRCVSCAYCNSRDFGVYGRCRCLHTDSDKVSFRGRKIGSSSGSSSGFGRGAGRGNAGHSTSPAETSRKKIRAGGKKTVKRKCKEGGKAALAWVECEDCKKWRRVPEGIM
jgi:hypothetical protein